jgi:hypothetical protein
MSKVIERRICGHWKSAGKNTHFNKSANLDRLYSGFGPVGLFLQCHGRFCDIIKGNPFAMYP